MPLENTYTQFKVHNKVHCAPIVIYADTESELNKSNATEGLGNNTVVCNYNAISFRLHIKSDNDLYGTPLHHSYVGLNTPIEFMKTLYTINTHATIILDTMCNNFKTIDLTDEEEI